MPFYGTEGRLIVLALWGGFFLQREGKEERGGLPPLFLLVGAEKTMTATDVTGFFAIFSTGFFATSPDFRGLVLLNCT